MMTQRYISFALAALFGLSLSAQIDEEITTVGDRKLSVGQAYKINELPSTIDTTASSYQMTYETKPRQVEVEYEPKRIKAAKLKVQEPLSKLYRGYIKGGVGMYVTPLVQARYNSLRSRKWAWGVAYDHLSSNGGVKGPLSSAYSENDGEIWARHYLRKHTIEGALLYERDVNHYYGWDPERHELAEQLVTDDDDIRQRYSTLGFRTALQSYYRDSSRISHRVELGYRNISTQWESTEGSFHLGADLSKWEGPFEFGLNFDLETNDLSPIADSRLKPGTAVDTLFGDLPGQGGTIIDIHPRIRTQLEDLTAEVGIGIVTDGAGDGTQFNFYPRAYVSYSLFDDLFTPYAGLTGDLRRNSLYSLSQQNPFILQNIALSNTDKKYELYGGIRGTILKDLSFNARASVASYGDHEFFINDSLFSEENAFTVVYDDMRAVQITGELSYKQSDALTVSTSLTISSFTTADLERPYGLPALEFRANAIYDLDDRFIVRASVFGASTRWGASPIGAPQDLNANGRDDKRLKGFVDSNLGFEYRYTKKISAFVQFDNITGGRYQRFFRYPVQPFTALGGFTYSF